jgi:hypothetical protein
MKTFELWPPENKEKMEILQPTPWSIFKIFVAAAVTDKNIGLHP